MNNTIKQAWAIALDDGHFIGSLWFGPLPEYADGSRTCLWRTRRQARAVLPEVKGPPLSGKFPDARVVRVNVRIGEVKR
jgi:hypothetical protein